MSVQTEIDRISQNIENTYAVLEALGCDVPTEKTSDNLASTAGTSKAVLFKEQTLTEEQKTQARTNIGAVSETKVKQLEEQIADLGGITDYVVTEAESVLSRVINAQGTRTFNMPVITDLHNNGGLSDAQITHACQGIGYIADRIKLDAFASLGDHTDSMGYSDWTECLKDILDCNKHKHGVKNTDFLEVPGNHDFKLSRSPITSKLISAFSTDVVWGNKLCGYFHKDYEYYKLRIIGVNTSETAVIGVSADQYNWFIETLDLSSKEDASEWQTLIISHVPLDWETFSVFANVLNAYVKGTSWTDGTYSCDYTGKNNALIIATIHGHIHNLMVSKMRLSDGTEIDLYRIAIPEVTELYQNHYEAPFKNDVTYSKVSGTAKDTSFNVLCIDLDSKKIEAICYGAGVDRTINYTSFDEPEEPDVPSTNYTNLIPTSINTDGSAFGTNGIEENTRWNSSGATAYGQANSTGLIECKANDIVYLEKCGLYNQSGSASAHRITYWNTSKTVLGYDQPWNELKTYIKDVKFTDGFITQFTVTFDGFFAVSGINSAIASELGVTEYLSEDSIITINEPITDGGSDGTSYEVDIASIGYTDNSRWSISDGTIRSGATGYTAINLIPFERKAGQTMTIELEGITWKNASNTAILFHVDGVYDSVDGPMYLSESKDFVDAVGLQSVDNGDGTMTVIVTDHPDGTMFNGFKLCGYGSGANAKVTITIDGGVDEVVNLFDKNDSDVVIGGRWSSSSGAFTYYGEGQLATGYIEAKVGDTFTLESDKAINTNGYTGQLYAFDSNKNHLAILPNGGWSCSDDMLSATFTIPETYTNQSFEDTAYIRLCIAYNNIDNIVITKN